RASRKRSAKAARTLDASDRGASHARMKPRAFSYLLPLFAVACGVGSEESATSSNDVTVTPSGPGGDITVTLVVPQDVTDKPVWQFFTDGDATAKNLTYDVGGISVVPGTAARIPFRPDSQGNTWVTIQYRGDLQTFNRNRSLTAAAPFKIASGEA